jgi:hypothetical protein
MGAGIGFGVSASTLVERTVPPRNNPSRRANRNFFISFHLHPFIKIRLSSTALVFDQEARAILPGTTSSIAVMFSR